MLKDKNYELKVIGAGLPRTGTLSLKSALEILTGQRCYHWADLMGDSYSDTQLWIDSLYSNNKENDWGKIFNYKYISTVNSPSEAFWEELMIDNPNAKIILTIRDSPNAWIESCNHTIFRTIFEENHSLATKVYSFVFRNAALKLYLIRLLAYKKWGILRYSDEEAIKVYNQRIEEVKTKVPKERLLIFNVKDGWGPLCKFLNVDIPKEPFPKMNDRETFIYHMRYQEFVGNLIITVGIGIIVGIGFGIRRYLFK